MASLPIFPLGTVLAPGRYLPIVVFEPRYVVLLRHLTEAPEQERQFGVVAIRSGHEVGDGAATALYDLGCSARVEGVQVASEGSFRVLTKGVRRFRLEGIDPEAPTPYLTGDVTWLDEPDSGAGDSSLAYEAARVRALIDAYRAGIGADPVDVDDVGTTPLDLSYAVGELILLDLADRQRLLACEDARSRLQLAARLLRRERALVSQFRALPHRVEVRNPPMN